MKKLLFILVLILFMGTPNAHADCIVGTPDCDPTITPTTPTNPTSVTTGFVSLTKIPGLTQGATADTPGLAKFFNNLYKFLIGIAAALAVIEIIWGGLEYSTQDSVSKKSDGKERILQAIFGLILVLSPYLVFSIINPSILNLSLNLPPIDLKTGAQQGTIPAGTQQIQQGTVPGAQQGAEGSGGGGGGGGGGSGF